MTDSEAAKGKWSDAAKSQRKQDVPSLDSVCSTLQADLGGGRHRRRGVLRERCLATSVRDEAWFACWQKR